MIAPRAGGTDWGKGNRKRKKKANRRAGRKRELDTTTWVWRPAESEQGRQGVEVNGRDILSPRVEAVLPGCSEPASASRGWHVTFERCRAHVTQIGPRSLRDTDGCPEENECRRRRWDARCVRYFYLENAEEVRDAGLP